MRSLSKERLTTRSPMLRFAARGALVAATLTLPLAGCGTIFGGTTETIHVGSSPMGATVTTRPETDTYTTPTSIELARKNSYTLHFSRDGYSEATYQVRNRLRGGILALDIITGIVPVVVDAATGGWYDLRPNDVEVSLEKKDAMVDGPERIRVSVRRASDGGVEITSDAPVTVGLEPDSPAKAGVGGR